MSLGDRVRIWLGLDDVVSLQQHEQVMAALDAMDEAQNRRQQDIMAALIRIENRTVPKQRATPINPSTWEEIQAAYAANPRNFEESA